MVYIEEIGMRDYLKHNIKVTDRVVSNQKSTSLDKMKHLRYNNIVNIIDKYADKKLPLLDIGARKGELLDMFNDAGFNNLSAIEIWPEGKKIMQNKGYAILNGDAEHFLTSSKFGTVIMSHVLEHCFYPDKVISNVYDSLILNGILYIEVPIQKEGSAPISAGHYSFFPKIDDIIFLFDNKWSVIEKGILRKKNIFVLMEKVRHEE